MIPYATKAERDALLEVYWCSAQLSGTLHGIECSACTIIALKQALDSLEASHARERKEAAGALRIMDHKVIACGVAASHADASLTLRDDYRKWDSPQAEAVRALRAEGDALREHVERLAESLEHYAKPGSEGAVARAALAEKEPSDE